MSAAWPPWRPACVGEVLAAMSENAAIACDGRSTGSGRDSHSYRCVGSEDFAQTGVAAFADLQTPG
jgi:hypothetical protein